MKVIGQAARIMINYLKSYAREGRYRADGNSGKILKAAFRDEAFLVWVNAYAEFIENFTEKLRSILMDLSSPRQEKLESILQKGLLSAISADKLAMLESRLEDALALPFEESVDVALKYLPKRTKIDVDIYLTVDPFNTGMMRPGKVFLSILLAEPTPKLAKGVAHEFHHVGAYYWLDKNLQLKALKSSHEHAQMLADVITYLVTEGMANWYTSPSAIHTVKGADKHNTRVRQLEQNMFGLLKSLEHLLSWICEQHKPVEEVKEAFQALSIDTSGYGIPAGHFLSGRMVGAMEKSDAVSREEIIDLVKHPFEFFDLYNRAVKEDIRLNVSLLSSVRSKVADWATTG